MADEEPIIVSGGDKPDNKRVKKIAIGGAVVLGLLVIGPRVLGGGGGTPSVTEFPVASASPSTTVAPGGDAVPETFQGFTSKNPFRPLVDLTAVAADAGTGTSSPVVDPSTPVVLPSDPSITPATIPGDVTGGGSGGGAPVPPADVPPPVPVRQPDRVGLLTIYGDQTGRTVANIRVNDSSYVVARGDSFAGSYQVISLDPYSRCGDFLFGDDRFRLCENEETFK
jgi:hypothetical protein